MHLRLLEQFRSLLAGYCPPCLVQYDLIAEKLREFKPSDWTDWASLITSVIGVFWILYQFNRLRRSAEQELDAYLERHLEQKLKDLKKERERVLPLFDEAHNASLLRTWANRSVARCIRLFLAFLRWVPLVPHTSELQYAIVKFKSGSYAGAKKQFDATGRKLLDLAKKYEKQAQAKRLEAGNRYLYSGCAAASLGDQNGTIEAFKQALEVSSDDADAHERIGCEYMKIGSLEFALKEFEELQKLAKNAEDRVREAKASRLKASVYKLLSRPVLAKRSLRRSLNIEAARNNQAKIGETLEMYGDLYRDQDPKDISRAASFYNKAIEAYRIASDHGAVARVEQSSWSLTNERRYFETFASRLLNRIAENLKTIAMRLRSPDHKP